jgi:hypothetical protein
LRTMCAYATNPKAIDYIFAIGTLMPVTTRTRKVGLKSSSNWLRVWKWHCSRDYGSSAIDTHGFNRGHTARGRSDADYHDLTGATALLAASSAMMCATRASEPDATTTQWSERRSTPTPSRPAASSEQ